MVLMGPVGRAVRAAERRREVGAQGRLVLALETGLGSGGVGASCGKDR